MSIPAACAPCIEPSSIAIDPRSFHVFEFEGEQFLFDRATGTTSALSPLAFSVLQQIEAGRAVETVLEDLPDADERTAVRLALNDLQERGFFRFWSVEAASDEALRPLWDHQPKRIQLLMAEGCNLGCRYCYQWRNGTNQKHTLMPWSVARDAIHHLIWRAGGRRDLQVTFFGGEPLLNYPMVKRVVEYCRALEPVTGKRFLFELITNGTLLDRDVVDFVVREKFLLFISLDGWKEMHEYNRPSLTGDDRMYETIVENARYANEQYKLHKLTPIKVRANLTNRFHDQAAVVQHLESLGFELIGVSAIEPLPHGDPSPAALTEDQMDELMLRSGEELLQGIRRLQQGERLGPFLRKLLNQSSAPLQKRHWHGITCGVARNTTIVDNRGNLYPCHRYAEMKAYCIGNVRTGFDRELVMAYYRKINGHSTESCQDCWIRDYCSGGCAWLLSDKQGNIHDPTPRECNRRRRSMELGLWVRKTVREMFPNRFGEAERQQWDAWNWDESGSIVPDCSTMEEHLDESSDDLEAAPPSGLLPVIENTSLAGSCGSCPSAGEASGCGCQSGPSLVSLNLWTATVPASPR